MHYSYTISILYCVDTFFDKADMYAAVCLTYRDRYAGMTLVIIGLGSGLSPVRHQAITWINNDLLSIKDLGTNLCEI